ncbi:MAG TPA: DUF6127 family protein [Allosphingosinicella sp.]|jgi:hypothetical protein
MTEANATMLALLVGQAERQGADLVTLRALIEEASEIGAERALGTLGLRDARARRDMDELRELLQAWRDAKKSAARAAIAWMLRIGLALLVLAMAVKLGLHDLVRR